MQVSSITQNTAWKFPNPDLFSFKGGNFAIKTDKSDLCSKYVIDCISGCRDGLSYGGH